MTVRSPRQRAGSARVDAKPLGDLPFSNGAERTLSVPTLRKRVAPKGRATILAGGSEAASSSNALAGAR